MNPQESWDQLLSAYAEGDWSRIEELSTELLEWLDHDGIPPKVLNRPDLGPDLNRALVRAGCLFALEAVQSRWSIAP